MQLQAFQPWERRDENDNIIRAGSYGKKSALTNAQNTGILDYIANNLDVLFAGFNELADDVYSKEDVYTKTETDERYVKKSGDTMSGALQGEGDWNIRNTTSNRMIILRGGTSSTDSANFILGGADNSSADFAGKAILRSSDGYKLSIGKNGVTECPSPPVNDNSTKIATTAYVQSNLANKLDKSGGKLSGALGFNLSGLNLNTINSEYLGKPMIVFSDTSNRECGKIGLWEADGVRNCTMHIRTKTNVEAFMGIKCDSNNNIFTYAPTPATNDNSTKIATTAFVNLFAQKKINKTRVVIDSITVGGAGYTSIGEYRPTINGTFLFCFVGTYGRTTNNDGGFDIDSSGGYLRGMPNTTITSLTIDYYYY